MIVDKDQDLGLSLSLASTAAHRHHHQHPFAALQLNIMPSSASPFAHHHHKSSSSPWTDLLAPLSGERELRGIDVNRAPAAEREMEEEAGVSSPNSTVSSVSGKRGTERDLQINGEENDTERAYSRGISDEDDGEGSRKKLRLSKDQSAILEESFKEHNTLNPKQKLALAKQLNLRPRQVEVWFQNRRARTKLKQTEVDCLFLKRCCENLTEENRRLQKEVQELRVLKLSAKFYMHMTPPTTLTMCPSCERVSSSAAAAAAADTSVQPQPQPRPFNSASAPWAPIPLRSLFLDAAPPQRS